MVWRTYASAMYYMDCVPCSVSAVTTTCVCCCKHAGYADEYKGWDGNARMDGWRERCRCVCVYCCCCSCYCVNRCSCVGVSWLLRINECPTFYCTVNILWVIGPCGAKEARWASNLSSSNPKVAVSNTVMVVAYFFCNFFSQSNNFFPAIYSILFHDIKSIFRWNFCLCI